MDNKLSATTKNMKYGNKKIKAYGLTFDSTKEFNYYNKLSLLKKAGEILDFKFQVPFYFEYNEKKIFKYKADFVVTNKDNSVEVIDIKAFDQKKQKFLTTETFNLKKKLIEAQHQIKIILK